jgi:hypothetical protein
MVKLLFIMKLVLNPLVLETSIAEVGLFVPNHMVIYAVIEENRRFSFKLKVLFIVICELV